MLWMLLADVARAGLVVGGMLGADVPLESDTRSDSGAHLGALVGWRQSILFVHVQPELIVRWDPVNDAAIVGPGFSATALDPIAIGVFAHVGLPWRDGPTWDAGITGELTLLPRLRPGVRIGYHRARIGEAGAADDFLTASAVLLVKL